MQVVSPHLAVGPPNFYYLLQELLLSADIFSSTALKYFEFVFVVGFVVGFVVIDIFVVVAVLATFKGIISIRLLDFKNEQWKRQKVNR